jgi:hypothetical protein
MALATAPRGMPSNPFVRRNNGRWAYRNDQQRESMLAAIDDVLNDCWSLHEDPMPGEASRPEEYLTRPGRISVNHLRRWVETWSTTYAEAPVRVFFYNGERLRDGPVLDALHALYRDAEVDAVLRRVDGDMRLFFNVVLRPWYDPDNEELVIHTYRAYDVRVVENRLNPQHPWATVVLGTEAELGRDGAYERVNVAEIYLPDEWLFVRGTTVVQRAPLPYNPLVHCFDRLPTLRTGYWGHAAGIALAALNVRLNEDGYSQFFSSLLMQAVSQLVMYGGQPDADVVVGPGRVLRADVESRIEYLSPGADLPGFRDGLEWLVRVIREVHGIPESMLDVQTQASGAAIVQANGPLTELRKARGQVFERIERDLLQSIVAVARGRVPGLPATLDPDSFDVSVNYVQPAASMSVQDSIAQEKHDLELGVLTAAEVLMRRHPDRFDSVAEADAWLAEQEGDAAGDVQSMALNGAQVAALQAVVQSVAQGLLPSDAAAIVIARAFPTFSEDEIARLVKSAASAPPPPAVMEIDDDRGNASRV